MVGETIGVPIALISSALGATASAMTRYVVGNADPVTLAILRWTIGFATLLPVALALRVRWPPRRDRPLRPAPVWRGRHCRCTPWSGRRGALQRHDPEDEGERTATPT